MMRGFGFGYPGIGMMGWGGGLLMLLLWILFAVGVVLLVVWAVRGARHGGMHAGMQGGMQHMPPMGGTTPPAADPAIETARHRLAAGEITKEQFDEIMAALKG